LVLVLSGRGGKGREGKGREGKGRGVINVEENREKWRVVGRVWRL
jgi:hypothetical protein